MPTDRNLLKMKRFDVTKKAREYFGDGKGGMIDISELGLTENQEDRLARLVVGRRSIREIAIEDGVVPQSVRNSIEAAWGWKIRQETRLRN